MAKKPTYSERLWPDTPEFNSLLSKWNSSSSVVLLTFVWKGYDIFCQEVLSNVDCSQSDEDLERNITQLFEPRIRQAMTGDEPFYLQHSPYEQETRKKSPAQPPQYDIAFVWRSNPRIMWPLEAKVLKTETTMTEYVKEIKNNFLTCRYAPFSNEGGMLGYLLEGTPENVFKNICKKLKCKLRHHTEFKERHHKISKHQRQVPQSKNYSHLFCCHHMILNIQKIMPS